MKKILSMALAIILAIGIIPLMAGTASAAQEGDYYYTVVDGEATITGYNGPGGDITIPNELGGCPVTKIGEWAFNDWNYKHTGRSLTGVNIPSGVTIIGAGAFDFCPTLVSVNIPNTVKSIGNSAFNYCPQLTSITIPDSVTSIGEEAFYGCYALTGVTIPSSVTAIGAHAFGFHYGYGGIYTRQRDFKVYCYKGTAGHTYASNNRLLFEVLDGTGSDNFLGSRFVRFFKDMFGFWGNIFRLIFLFAQS